MNNQHKRRTLEETEEIAREHFRALVKDSLPAELMKELESNSIRTAGFPSPQWQKILGYMPDEKMHYEFAIYKPSDSFPFVEKVYACILVSRDRSSEFCKIVWLPEWQGTEERTE